MFNREWTWSNNKFKKRNIGKISQSRDKTLVGKNITLAYAIDIAGLMLKRQQAKSIIKVREKIVQLAVSIIGYVINSLQANNIVYINNEERVRLVSKMLVVMCSETNVTPTLIKIFKIKTWFQ